MTNRTSSRGHSQSTPVRAGGHVVGEVRGDTFYKSISDELHFLKKPRAIANDVQVLKDAEAAGARYVEVWTTDTHRTYRAAISTIWARGFAVNRGWGPQWALALACWRDDAELAGEQLQLALFA